MKLQHLVIIFLIIIVPISLVLSVYVSGYIDTIKNQSSYDAHLLNATYDGIKAFQLNTAANSYSTIGNSKIRDIEAAISTFFSSLATNLGFSGYSEEDVRQHVPAILFNLYDGYYIYSNYYDTESDTYKYGLKPFMYYSCRYVKGSNYDFVVNYTLDNTITVIGIVDGNYVTKTGHLILDDGFTPETEILTEDLITLDNQGVDTSYTKESYQYTIYNSQKIYKENGINDSTPNQDRYFYYSSTYSKDYINDLTTLEYLNNHLIGGNLISDSAQKYYQEGKEFTQWANANLSGITQENAVDVDGNKITTFSTDTGNEEIFVTSDTNNPLQSGSTFNENRLSVIRYSIETNLVSSITNFTNHSIIGYDFALPELNEEDWDKIENNISILTFLQGIPIGGKIYNHYSVVSNDSNKETVGNNSIYIIDSNGEYHKPGCKKLIEQIESGAVTIAGAYPSSDFERRTVSLTGSDANAGAQLTGTDSDAYAFFYPQIAEDYSETSSACYDCMVTVSDEYSTDDIIEGVVTDINGNSTNIPEIQKVYLTALARARYDLYVLNEYFGYGD